MQRFIKTAVILAGGKGERLSLISGGVPKPLVKIDGKPIIERQVELLKEYGFEDLHILTGYKGEMIEEYFSGAERFGVKIKCWMEKEPLGTAGCLKGLEGVVKNDFMLLFGDVVLNMDMATLISYHWQKNAVATLVVHPNDHPFDSDLVDIDEDSRIRQLFLKGNKPDFYTNQANAAVHILSPAVFKYIPSGKSDLMVDVIAKMLVDQRPIYGYKTAEYIKDIGAVERFRMVEKDIQSGKVDRLSKKNKRKAVFIDRDGTLVEDVDLLCKIDDLRLFDFSCDSIKNINASEFLSIIVTNQPVVARNLCSTSDVERIHRKLETLLGNEGAYLNDIYFCPHHPDSGYPGENPKFKITCECRKPATGMIQKAAEEYNIDLSASWMIGDTTVDMQMGKNAGLKTALVRTGRAGRDEKFDVKPDMICDNLAVAVDNILRLEEKKQ